MSSRLITPILALSLLLVSALTTTIAKAEDDEKDLKFFRIGAGPTSESLYALSTAISASISRPPGSLPCNTLGGVCGVPGLIAVAQSKSGSIENLAEIKNGDVDSALVRADVAKQAYQGSGPFSFQGQNENLRVIANIFPVKAHIVVKKSSEIKEVLDLVGKTVSVGAKGSGTDFFARALMEAHGHKIYDFRYSYMRPGPAVDALVAGDIDAAIIIGAAPIPALAELQGRSDMHLIPIGSRARVKLKESYDDLHDDFISAYHYNLDFDVNTVGINVQWVVNASADIELIEDITQAFWQSETEAFFLRNNPRHSFPSMEDSLPKGVIPPHQGAVNYYKSHGLM